MAALLEETVGLPWLSVIFLLTPVTLELLLLGYMPELFHTALLSLFFLLLLRRRQRSALVVLFFAFLTRESTLGLCLVCIYSGWVRGERRLTFGSIAVLVAGILAGAWSARLGMPNTHHLPEFVYLPLKIGYNFLRSILGIMFWSNTMVPARSTPQVIWNLPSFLHLGLIRQIGVSFQWGPPFGTFVTLSAVFGVAPLICIRIWKNKDALDRLPVGIHVAFWYGFILFFLAPSLGASIFRLSGEAWPLVWIAIPCIIKHFGVKVTFRQCIGLTACYQLVAWVPLLVGFWGGSRNYVWLVAIPMLYIVAERIIVQTETQTLRSARQFQLEKPLTFQ
jgi:hypothetical protein